MRMTFIRDEINGHQIIVSGVMREVVSLPDDVPQNIYAVQVYPSFTEVEYSDLTNERFETNPFYVQSLVAAWQAAEPEVPPEPTTEESLEEWRQTAEVTRFQAKAALLQLGRLETVQTYMASDQATPLEKLAWDEAKFTRRSQLVSSLGSTLLGLTDTQLDDLFKLAATIEA